MILKSNNNLLLRDRLGEEVAAFVEGGVAILYGLRRTAVQAAQTHGAVAMPLRHALWGVDCDVVHGAACHTSLAVGAAVGHYAETAIADGKVQKQRTNDCRLEPLVFAGDHLSGDAALRNAQCYLVDASLGIVELLFLKQVGVNVKSGQTDIDVWHLHRKGGVALQAQLRYLFCE